MLQAACPVASIEPFFANAAMLGNFRSYCPEPTCKKFSGGAFTACTLDALIEQIRQHAEDEGTCEHFVGRNKQEFDEIIRLHYLETGWRDVLDQVETPAGGTDPAPAAAASRGGPAPVLTAATGPPQGGVRRSRSRSPSIQRRPAPAPADFLTELVSETRALMECTARLHRRAVAYAQNRPHPAYILHPSGAGSSRR